MKFDAFSLPDHLSSSNEEQRGGILTQMREIHQNIKKVNREVDELGPSLMTQISRSEDDVSKALHQIFESKITHSPKELQQARDRRELGNPPGKKNDPIGDQLTWEQILTHFNDKKRLWIISRDGDSGTTFGKESFLNRFLYDELCNISSEPEVYFFNDIANGIQHFIDTTGVDAENRLTPEEVEEIKREEDSLSNVIPSGNSRQEAFEMLFRQPSKSTLEALRALEAFGTSTQLGVDMQKISESFNQSNIDIQSPFAQLGVDMQKISESFNQANIDIQSPFAQLGVDMQKISESFNQVNIDMKKVLGQFDQSKNSIQKMDN